MWVSEDLVLQLGWLHHVTPAPHHNILYSITHGLGRGGGGECTESARPKVHQLPVIHFCNTMYDNNRVPKKTVSKQRPGILSGQR